MMQQTRGHIEVRVQHPVPVHTLNYRPRYSSPSTQPWISSPCPHIHNKVPPYDDVRRVTRSSSAFRVSETRCSARETVESSHKERYASDMYEHYMESETNDRSRSVSPQSRRPHCNASDGVQDILRNFHRNIQFSREATNCGFNTIPDDGHSGKLSAEIASPEKQYPLKNGFQTRHDVNEFPVDEHSSSYAKGENYGREHIHILGQDQPLNLSKKARIELTHGAHIVSSEHGASDKPRFRSVKSWHKPEPQTQPAFESWPSSISNSIARANIGQPTLTTAFIREKRVQNCTNNEMFHQILAPQSTRNVAHSEAPSVKNYQEVRKLLTRGVTKQEETMRQHVSLRNDKDCQVPPVRCQQRSFVSVRHGLPYTRQGHRSRSNTTQDSFGSNNSLQGTTQCSRSNPQEKQPSNKIIHRMTPKENCNQALSVGSIKGQPGLQISNIIQKTSQSYAHQTIAHQTSSASNYAHQTSSASNDYALQTSSASNDYAHQTSSASNDYAHQTSSASNYAHKKSFAHTSSTSSICTEPTSQVSKNPPYFSRASVNSSQMAPHKSDHHTSQLVTFASGYDKHAPSVLCNDPSAGIDGLLGASNIPPGGSNGPRAKCNSPPSDSSVSPGEKNDPPERESPPALSTGPPSETKVPPSQSNGQPAGSCGQTSGRSSPPAMSMSNCPHSECNSSHAVSSNHTTTPAANHGSMPPVTTDHHPYSTSILANGPANPPSRCNDLEVPLGISLAPQTTVDCKFDQMLDRQQRVDDTNQCKSRDLGYHRRNSTPENYGQESQSVPDSVGETFKERSLGHPHEVPEIPKDDPLSPVPCNSQQTPPVTNCASRVLSVSNDDPKSSLVMCDVPMTPPDTNAISQELPGVTNTHLARLAANNNPQKLLTTRLSFDDIQRSSADVGSVLISSAEHHSSPSPIVPQPTCPRTTFVIQGIPRVTDRNARKVELDAEGAELSPASGGVSPESQSQMLSSSLTSCFSPYTTSSNLCSLANYSPTEGASFGFTESNSFSSNPEIESCTENALLGNLSSLSRSESNLCNLTLASSRQGTNLPSMFQAYPNRSQSVDALTMGQNFGSPQILTPNGESTQESDRPSLAQPLSDNAGTVQAECSPCLIGDDLELPASCSHFAFVSDVNEPENNDGGNTRGEGHHHLQNPREKCGSYVCEKEVNRENLCVNPTEELGVSRPVFNEVTSSVEERKRTRRIGIASIKLSGQKCQICQDSASGFHYGVWSCEGCKAFFKRSLQGHMEYVCPAVNNCTIDRNRRKSCQACRLNKCIEMGMSRGISRKEKSCRIGTVDRPNGKRLSSESSDSTEAKKTSPDTSNESKPSVPHQPLVAKEEAGISSEPKPGQSQNKAHLVDLLQDPVSVPQNNVSVHPYVAYLLHIEPQLRYSKHNSSLPDTAVNLMGSLLQLADDDLLDVIQWAKAVPGYKDLSLEVRIHLLESCWMEILVISLAWRSLPYSNVLAFACDFHFDSRRMELSNCNKVWHPILKIISMLKQHKLTNEEMVLLKATSLLNADILDAEEEQAKVLGLQHELEAVWQHTVVKRGQHPTSRVFTFLLLMPNIRQCAFNCITQIFQLKNVHNMPIEDLLHEMMNGPKVIARTEMETCEEHQT